ncbi:peptide/nickel transport system substrate-binding protein [Methanomicrobium sp. W14]|uniref:ABC transporter substrate-binding protein n=1 Tax=Methanomicrobium sp. W14 TaxID=2817839 RepID=UPI001AE3E5A9|nr:ABC transporter substrate-binding protein [Methanomicrobium sp. W14]MBP2132681.1 peptide/nickel transport system substrate-binding protein [Methanomicrobium sp. W14]
MRNLYLILAVSAFAASLFISGCTSTTQTENSSDNILKVGDMWDISSINPATSSLSGVLVTEKSLITETLVSANDNFELVPNLAESWEQINDTTWEFKLREGVKFHNGREMTAKDVVVSLDDTMELSPSTASLISYDHSDAVDNYTVRIYTTELNPLVPGALHYPCTAIVSPDSYDSDGNFVKPIGTGPMKFKSYDEQTGELVVDKNTDWWKEEPGFDGIVIKGYENSETRAMLIENGDVDFTCDPPYSEVKRLNETDGIHVEIYNTPRIYKLDANLKNPDMADLNMRKAISYAIDRDGIVKNVLYGVGSSAGGVFLPSMEWANKSLSPYPYDPQLAKEYLAKSGWTDSDGDGILDKDGEKLKLRLFTYTERPGLSPMLEAISANLRDIGFEVDETAMEYSSLSSVMSDDNWDLYLSAPTLAFVPDPEYVLKSWYTTNGTSNKAGYSNPAVDKMIEEGHHINDVNERYDHFGKIEGIVYNDLPTINVAYYGVAVVMKDNVNGYRFDPTAHDYRIDPFMIISS